MMIQCNACSAAEATVMCCADEAALCSACDHKVHAANKLAGKHHRVPLLRAALPTCDICQEGSGYFFCLEDRALLCRNCDVSIHTANSHVSCHRRFLITGVQVGLEPSDPITPLDIEQSSPVDRVTESTAINPSVSISEEVTELFPSQLDLVSNKAPFPGSSMFGGIPDWPLNEFFGFSDSNPSYGFMDHYSSKADSGKFGSSEGSPPCYALGEGLDADECWAQVPEVPWTVPEIPSPPTASGLHWQKNLHYPAEENTMFVPDIRSSQGTGQGRVRATDTKRRKLF